MNWSGLAQVDFAVQSLVDIFFSFALTESQWIPQVLDHYITLLLCDDANVSHAAKSALQRSMRSCTTQRVIWILSSWNMLMNNAIILLSKNWTEPDFSINFDL